jgi:hypothetical protein
MNIASINFELFSPPSNYLESLRNYVFYFTLYQILLMITFKLYETDALSAIKSTIDKFHVFVEFNRKFPQEDLIQLQETIDSTNITFSKKHRQELKELIQYLQCYNVELISKDDIRAYLKLNL